MLILKLIRTCVNIHRLGIPDLNLLLHICIFTQYHIISIKIGSQKKIVFVLNRKNKSFNHSHFMTNTALWIKFHARYVFINILIFSYYAQIHPNVTVQYLKSIPIVQKAWKTCVHTSVSDKNQSSSQTKEFNQELSSPNDFRNIWTRSKYIFTYMYN